MNLLMFLSTYRNILYREQTVPSVPTDGFLKIQKKPVSELFETWKEFCQEKITRNLQDDEDNNNEEAPPNVIPAKTNDKGMPRDLPVDENGIVVLPLLDAQFKSMVPGFVRQEMLRTWLTYWYSVFGLLSFSLDGL